MKTLFPGTCVSSIGRFVYCIHKPQFTALNFRESDRIATLGHCSDNRPVDNRENFPEGNVAATNAQWVFEIPNAFPFMGRTFILKSHADRMSGGTNPFKERLAYGEGREIKSNGVSFDLGRLPRELRLALARVSTDPRVLAALAARSCHFEYDGEEETPVGMRYEETQGGGVRPAVGDWPLFDLVSSNPYLPDPFKRHMVLIPGAQGSSPVVGEYSKGGTHIWEFLRENSYIPWGHYAANMAEDAVRYTMRSLSHGDMTGLRHLYYQRIYGQMAGELGLPVPAVRRTLSPEELEDLRLRLLARIEGLAERGQTPRFNGTVWGQNFGMDFSPSGYRLNASHQQIHQQFALLPSEAPVFSDGRNEDCIARVSCYAQGELVGQFAGDYGRTTGGDFFASYLRAIESNARMDGRADKDGSLVIHQDEHVVVFVPKAQRSQGEIQIMARRQCGNIIEADLAMRSAFDRCIWLALRLLENLGADMITVCEISKRFDALDSGQRLIYCFLPRHPQSPGGFSEWQQRWILNHYPEDFARSCRDELERVMDMES